MPHSHNNVLLHVIFSTKDRRPFLQDAEIRTHLNAYLVGILKNLKCPSLATNCVADHVHTLFLIRRTITIADVMREFKGSSSAWLKTQSPDLRKFQWQTGYGSFSVSQSLKSVVKKYIHNQDEHHKKTSYQDEYRKFCKLNGIEIDERYDWD